MQKYRSENVEASKILSWLFVCSSKAWWSFVLQKKMNECHSKLSNAHLMDSFTWRKGLKTAKGFLPIQNWSRREVLCTTDKNDLLWKETCLYIHPLIYHLSVYLFTYLCITYLSIYLSIFLSIIYPSICLSFFRCSNNRLISNWWVV